MELSGVVPWGRSLKEYVKMFSLSDNDLNKTILGCSDGPASFNTDLTKAGGKIVSVDPIYQFSPEQIETRIEEVYSDVMNQMVVNADDYVWENIRNPEELGQVRMNSMKCFLNDFETGKTDGRYLNASLPDLPFQDDKFDLALCSHYLFLYSSHVNLRQHILSMKELCRVAREVRVYPLLSITDNKKSEHLDQVMSALNDSGIDTFLESVDYEFQKGATQMLVARRS